MPDAGLNQRLKQIAAKLQSARKAKCKPFGVEAHKLRCKPKLAAAEVTKFERRFRIKLPPDYRAFLTQVANGGAGPGYGLFSLQNALPKKWLQMPTDYLTTNFRYRQAYNSSEDPKVERFFYRYALLKVTAAEMEHFVAYEAAGTIELCDEGCGMSHLLVVTDPTRGKVWVDDRCNSGYLAPLKVTFLDWYERWLDNTLAGGDGDWWNNEDEDPRL